MGGKTVWYIVLFLLPLLIPLIALGAKISDKESGPPTFSAAESSQSAPQSATGPPQSIQTAAILKILDKPVGEALTVNDKGFFYGAVVTETSPESPVEILKAQAVSAYTYYSRPRAQRREKPDASLKGADLSADISGWKLYTIKAEMQKRWGSRFDTHYQTLGKAADTVYGQTLQDDGQLIRATYYAVPSDDMEATKDIWGGDYSYLVPVVSPGDLYVSGYSTTVTLAPQQVQQASQRQWSISLDDDPSKWFGRAKRIASNSVTDQTLGGKTMKGGEARTVFGLRFVSHIITYTNDKFTFSVKGCGRGVDVNQTGAEYMAQHSSNYKQILERYYPDAKLVSA